MRRSKYSEPYSRDSQPSTPKTSQMSMDRKVTREQYEAREIVQNPISKSEQRAENQVKLTAEQKKMKPIRASSQTTDLNRR